MEQKRKNKPSFLLLITFWALVGTFAAMMGPIIFPSFGRYIGSCFFIIIGSILILGAVLIFLTRKEKIEGALKKFLMLTGASAVGFIVAIFLHNFFYALNVITSDIAVLRYLTEGLHIIFFLIAVPISPLFFLVGVLGTILQLFLKKKK